MFQRFYGFHENEEGCREVYLPYVLVLVPSLLFASIYSIVCILSILILRHPVLLSYRALFFS